MSLHFSATTTRLANEAGVASVPYGATLYISAFGPVPLPTPRRHGDRY
jgi:hypothetical protein